MLMEQNAAMIDWLIFIGFQRESKLCQNGYSYRYRIWHQQRATINIQTNRNGWWFKKTRGSDRSKESYCQKRSKPMLTEQNAAMIDWLIFIGFQRESKLCQNGYSYRYRIWHQQRATINIQTNRNGWWFKKTRGSDRSKESYCQKRSKPIDFHWFSSTFIDFHWFSLIFIDFHWFSFSLDFH